MILMQYQLNWKEGRKKNLGKSKRNKVNGGENERKRKRVLE